MPNRYHPTVKDIVYSTIAMIHHHRYIQNPIVTHPVANIDGVYEPVPINRYRTYDGIELLEPGLTLAVFPSFESDKAVEFKEYELGPKRGDYQYEATYNFVLALFYQEVSINEDTKYVYYHDNDKLIAPDKKSLKERGVVIPKLNTDLQIEINPAEDILRDYLDVLRIILEEGAATGLLPWRLRGSQVTSFEFPTTSWLKENTDIYFHKAKLHWQISVFAPSTFLDDLFAGTIDRINLYVRWVTNLLHQEKHTF